MQLPAERTQSKHKLEFPLDHLESQPGNGFAGIQALRASLGAVEDGVAAIDPEGVLELVEALARRLVPAVIDPAGRLDQRGWPEEALGIPPIARAGRRAAGT